MMGIASDLEKSMDELLVIYAPFSEPGRNWQKTEESIQDLVARRDQALAQGKPASDRFKELWAAWEKSNPDQAERARIFQARNRIVELGLQVSRSDSSIQSQLQRKAEELRRLAVESERKSKVAQAYAGSRSR